MRVSPEIANLIPYAPGKPIAETQREYGLNRIIKLASNENPFGPSPRALASMQEGLITLHRYPDPACVDLKNRVAELWQLAPDRIAVGNSSNELIDLLIRIFCEPGEKILTPQYSFIAYEICAQAARVGVIKLAVDEHFMVDVQKLIEMIQLQQPRLVFIANPNNPTGTYLNASELEALLTAVTRHAPNTLVVIDEAYFEYANATDYVSALGFKDELRSQLVVLRTFSKAYALAGLRVGLAIAPPQIVDYIHRVRNPFNVNTIGQLGAMAALEDAEHLTQGLKIHHFEMQRMQREYARRGLHFYPSQANFFLLKTPVDGAVFYQELLRRGVITRPLKPYGLHDFSRVTVGLPDENTFFLKALDECWDFGSNANANRAPTNGKVSTN